MAITNVFKTATKASSPLDGSGDSESGQVSDFLTVQSFTNFAAMTGAITAAWNGLQRLFPAARAIWVPYALAGVFATISILISIDGLKKQSSNKLEFGTLSAAVFVGFVNALVLAGAVVGTDAATNSGG